MGFFDRIAKSFLGKNEPEVATLADSKSYASTARFTPASLPSVVPVATNGHHRVPERSAAFAASAVAVAELPEVAEVAPAPESSAEPAGPALFDTDFDQDLDDVFASLVTQEASPEAENSSQEVFAEDQAAVEVLFADIAANYARPVKNFIFELKRGTATREWIDICRPAMHGITRAAEGMGLTLAAKHMVDFEAALSLAQGSEERVLGGEIRDLLLWCYEDLIKVMPQAFVVGEEEQQREGIIINSLLMQIPDVGRVTVEKLYRAGLTSLDTLYLAKKDDLAVATGIPANLSELICEKFQAYRSRLETNPRDPGDLGQCARLQLMVTELRRHHEGFQRASENEWSNPELACRKTRLPAATSILRSLDQRPVSRSWGTRSGRGTRETLLRAAHSKTGTTSGESARDDVVHKRSRNQSRHTNRKVN